MVDSKIGKRCSLTSFILSQAIKLIEYDNTFDDAQKKQAKALKISCNLNMAACKLKLKDYREVVKLTTMVGY